MNADIMAFTIVAPMSLILRAMTSAATLMSHATFCPSCRSGWSTTAI